MSCIISIVTPCLNASSTIAEALESAIFQKTEGVEHLVIDGLSSDGTPGIVGQYDGIRMISEADKGIYDAMNKGVSRASGEWILFLQADDWLPKGAIRAYFEAIKNNPSAKILCGGATAVKQVGEAWVPVWSVTDSQEKQLSVKNIALGEPMINARLIRRDAFLELGGFSPEYALASDRDFLLKAAEAGFEQREIDGMTYRYRWHAGSSTMTEGNALSDRLLGENIRIAEHHLKLSSENGNEPLRRWHTGLRVQGAMNGIESGKVRVLWEHMEAGVSRDPFWPAALFREICRSLPGFMCRGFRSRSMKLRKGRTHD